MILLKLFSKNKFKKNNKKNDSIKSKIVNTSFDKIMTSDKLPTADYGKLILKLNPSIKLVAEDEDVMESDLILTIIGKNIFSGEYDNGYLKYGVDKLYDKNSENFRTTKWFPILAKQGRSLVLSGTGFNRSTWQFKTADETVLTMEGTSQKYNVTSDVMQDRTVSKVDIPENAVYARVYYACYDESIADNRVQIEYGKVVTYYCPYMSCQIKLPHLKKSDHITYEKGLLTLFSGSRKEDLELEAHEIGAGYTVAVNSNTCSVNVTYGEAKKEITNAGIYGVRWNINDPCPICERVGDAKGLTFNAMHNSRDLTPYENSFDTIYPWSEIKICSVKIKNNGTRKIIYSNEEGFSTSSGNIMVKIPKYYCKREVINSYEYVWISATEQDGFSLDSSFETKDGTIDNIYIGAYLSSVVEKKLKSISNSFPLIKKSLRELQSLALNSKGIAECDLLAILTVQRLFLVETAVLDSQTLFTGNVYLPYLLKDKKTPYYAVLSEQVANRIIVKNIGLTKRFCLGDAISILGSWKEYKNKPMVFQREIIGINTFDKDNLEIVFSGEPVSIIKHETGITCIPCKNGITDQLSYITGSVGNLNGHASFKYRGIENLWGSVSILLDNAYVKESELFIKYPAGHMVKVGYKLPIQKVELFPTQFGDPANMIVKKMGYDKNNPLIMFPCEIGNGATTSSYYCDAWYNLAEEGITYILTYGGAWDNKGYAGIFNFRASFVETKKMPYNGSRIMLIRE